MTGVGLIFLGMLGFMWPDTPKNNKNEEIYNKEFFRKNLSNNHYDNFMIDEVAYQMKDNYLKDEFKYLIRGGLTVERAVDELVRTDKIKF